MICTHHKDRRGSTLTETCGCRVVIRGLDRRHYRVVHCNRHATTFAEFRWQKDRPPLIALLTREHPR